MIEDAAKPHRAKLAIVVSHVIHYFCPQYVSWASLPDVEIKVFFGSRRGLSEYFDDQFGRVIRWEGLDLSFPHEFVPGAETRDARDNDAPELDGLLELFDPDLVLIYGYDQPLLRRTIRWAQRNRVDLFMLSDAESRSGSPLLKRLAKKIILPHLLKQFSLFLTVGDANEAFYRSYGVTDERFVRCCFPIDRASFDRNAGTAEESRRRLRSALKIPTHHKVILSVGKLVPWKRMQDLVQVSNLLQGLRDDITVVLAGAGQDETELRAMSKTEGPGGVIFAGFVKPAELVDYYFAADVYVASSERDRHSLAVTEAIYAGLPVVISDRCGSYGPSDDVRPGLNGFVYPCGDIQELMKLLLHVLEDAGLRERMSRASASLGRHSQTLAHGEALSQALAVIRSQNGSRTGGRQK